MFPFSTYQQKDSLRKMEADRFLGSTNENFFKKVAQLNGLARAIYLLFILFMRVGKNTLYIAVKSQTQSFFLQLLLCELENEESHSSKRHFAACMQLHFCEIKERDLF